MVLRKCPSCREIVGAESAICPRCGVNFRAAIIRRYIVLPICLLLAAWAVCHYVLKVL
ncbi:MAG TPA: hypothetical protein VMD30_02400 [Tepidisphaeraceae bacterium]|nr:hypothetical protein [Tepidisphaeraceae bacterium]